MFKKIIKSNVDLVTQKPKLILLIACVMTIISGVLATKLDIELNWVALAPQGHHAVQEYDQIIKDFPALNTIIVLVEGKDVKAIKDTSQALENAMETLDEYVLSTTSGLDSEFVLDNLLLMADEETAKGLAYTFTDPNLDGFLMLLDHLLADENIPDITKGYIEDLAAEMVHYSGDAKALEAVLKHIFAGSPMLQSGDKSLNMIMIQPTFDIMDIAMLEPGVNAIESVIKQVSKESDDVTISVTGMHIVARDETASIQSDSSLTTVMALVCILLILYFAFRSWQAPILAFIPLILGIVWTVGLTQLFVGRLNMMTAFAAAMLIGLGIDYAIHMYSSYTERRSLGDDKVIALNYAISISGPGIVTGALTTAAAFFALNVSKLELLSELGTVMAMGILSTLVSVFWVLPALLILKKEKDVKMLKVKGHYPWIGWVATKVKQYKIIVIILLLLSTAFMANEARQAEFDLNLMNLEPKGLESIRLMNYMIEAYDMSADSFSVSVDSLEDVYKYHKSYEALEGVKEVISVASLIPEEEFQTKRLALLEMIRNTGTAEERPIEETFVSKWVAKTLKRSEDEVVSNFAKASVLGNDFYKIMNELGQRMLAVTPLTTKDLPENYKQQFISKDGQRFLITVYPDFDIWDNLQSEKGENFFKAIGDVNSKITGSPIFMKVLYDSASEEMFTIAILLIGILMVILFIHFRSFKYTVFAILPLVFTMVFTLGTMHLIDLKFNIMNFLSILLIIGIGIDDGVHILHHYKQGVHKMGYLFSSVGRAIMLTTVTTVCGFGSLAFSSYRGIASLGISLSIGVVYAFIMTIVVLPILLKE